MPHRTGDGGLATEARILGSRAGCVDRQRNTYTCEREGNGVRKIDTYGIMATFAGNGAHGYTGDDGPVFTPTWGVPQALRCDRYDHVLVVDTANRAIRRIDAVTGGVTPIADGRQGAQGDEGPATAAGLDRPQWCEVDAHGHLLIADRHNHRVRVVGM